MGKHALWLANQSKSQRLILKASVSIFNAWAATFEFPYLELILLLSSKSSTVTILTACPNFCSLMCTSLLLKFLLTSMLTHINNCLQDFTLSLAVQQKISRITTLQSFHKRAVNLSSKNTAKHLARTKLLRSTSHLVSHSNLLPCSVQGPMA